MFLTKSYMFSKSKRCTQTPFPSQYHLTAFCCFSGYSFKGVRFFTFWHIIKKRDAFSHLFSSDLFTVSLCSHTPYQLLPLQQRNFFLFISEFIAIQIKDCMLHKVLKIKDFYIFRFCSNTIVSTWLDRIG